MSRQNYIFTSESVSEGHPDKVCDRISDEVVDLFIGKDPLARVACETLTTTNQIVLAGEVRCADQVEDDEIEAVVRAAVRDIGYEQEGFHWKHCNLTNYLHAQSKDIADGVDNDTGTYKEEGAGDQGIMFGYATNETPQMMPAPIQFSHEILSRMADLRKSDPSLGLEPDAKSQVTLVYENGLPVRASSIVISTQHRDKMTPDDIRQIVRPIVLDILPEGWMCPEDEFYVNPTGNFVIGGPDGDSGLTGRKIIVDTYGGAAPHGGGAFSGKDPTKVDRSAAYISRYLAKNVVAAGLAKRCSIQLSYAIGVAKPLSVYVDLHGSDQCDVMKLEKALPEIVDLSPRGIRDVLQLNRPIYARTAAYGHFGRQPDNEGGFSWEKTDLVEQLRSFAS
ncbi:S-adenosylmethionine synthetase [hydrothermal vent metagenome]|uniref:methionine adenosyltransferase n=1 Tax=hydrothermal vent metagenome TaxID=652676 RepID=A0A3B0S9V0_9ZZZZ